jgi:hypothetical protein
MYVVPKKDQVIFVVLRLCQQQHWNNKTMLNQLHNYCDRCGVSNWVNCFHCCRKQPAILVYSARRSLIFVRRAKWYVLTYKEVCSSGIVNYKFMLFRQSTLYLIQYILWNLGFIFIRDYWFTWLTISWTTGNKFTSDSGRFGMESVLSLATGVVFLYCIINHHRDYILIQSGTRIMGFHSEVNIVLVYN